MFKYQDNTSLEYYLYNPKTKYYTHNILGYDTPKNSIILKYDNEILMEIEIIFISPGGNTLIFSISDNFFKYINNEMKILLEFNNFFSTEIEIIVFSWSFRKTLYHDVCEIKGNDSFLNDRKSQLIKHINKIVLKNV